MIFFFAIFFSIQKQKMVVSESNNHNPAPQVRNLTEQEHLHNPTLLPPTIPPDSPTPPESPSIRPISLREYLLNDNPFEHLVPARTDVDDVELSDDNPALSPRYEERIISIHEIIDEMIRNGDVVPVTPRPGIVLYAPIAPDPDQPRNPLFHSRPPPPTPIQPRRRRFSAQEIADAIDVDQTGYYVNFTDANGTQFSYRTGYYPPSL